MNRIVWYWSDDEVSGWLERAQCCLLQCCGWCLGVLISVPATMLDKFSEYSRALYMSTFFVDGMIKVNLAMESNHNFEKRKIV